MNIDGGCLTDLRFADDVVTASVKGRLQNSTAGGPAVPPGSGGVVIVKNNYRNRPESPLNRRLGFEVVPNDVAFQLNSSNKESKKFGLKIHGGKTKFTRNLQTNESIVVENDEIEKDKCLGQMVKMEDNTREEVHIKKQNKKKQKTKTKTKKQKKTWLELV